MTYEEHCLLMKTNGKQPYTREEFNQKRLDTLEKAECLKALSEDSKKKLNGKTGIIAGICRFIADLAGRSADYVNKNY